MRMEFLSDTLRRCQFLRFNQCIEAPVEKVFHIRHSDKSIIKFVQSSNDGYIKVIIIVKMLILLLKVYNISAIFTQLVPEFDILFFAGTHFCIEDFKELTKLPQWS